jgi:hypothetical protein
LVSEGVEDVIASVHGVSEHVQMLEHSLVCDLSFHGLINDDLSSEKSPLQSIRHTQHRWLGAFADEEIYGSRSQLAQDSRNKNLHYRTSPQKTTKQVEERFAKGALQK